MFKQKGGGSTAFWTMFEKLHFSYTEASLKCSSKCVNKKYQTVRLCCDHLLVALHEKIPLHSSKITFLSSDYLSWNAQPVLWSCCSYRSSSRPAPSPPPLLLHLPCSGELEHQAAVVETWWSSWWYLQPVSWLTVPWWLHHKKEKREEELLARRAGPEHLRRWFQWKFKLLPFRAFHLFLRLSTWGNSRLFEGPGTRDWALHVWEQVLS